MWLPPRKDPYMDPVVAILLPWASTLAAGAVSVGFGYGLNLLRKRGMDTRFFEAVGRAGGVAYSALLSARGSPTDPAALAQAAQAGAAYLIDRVPQLIQARNLQPADVTQIAGGELGKLLAADPSITPASKASAPL